MKNIIFAFLGLLLFSPGAVAQLKAVPYTDGNQKLKGLYMKVIFFLKI